jgi:glutaredoxin
MRSATVYWRPGCPFCLTLRLGLRLTRTPHRLVNVREDPEASAFVRRHNGGDELVPTVAIGDRVLSNPRLRDVQRALADT